MLSPRDQVLGSQILVESSDVYTRMVGAQILVVDDSTSILRLVSFLLQNGGYAVKTAASAEDAIQMLQSLRPDIILMDLEMPHMDGMELTHILRRDPTYQRTKIIVLTAHTGASFLKRVQAAGCNGCIAKPFDPRTFVRLVEEHLNGPATDEGGGGNLLTELSHSFLNEGLEQCAKALKTPREGEYGLDLLLPEVHQWIGLGGTLGFPEISNHARELDALLNQAPYPRAQIEEALS